MKVQKEINLVEELKMRRISLGLTQEKVAKQLGVSTMGLSYLERGERMLKLQTLEKWCEILGIKITLSLS